MLLHGLDQCNQFSNWSNGPIDTNTNSYLQLQLSDRQTSRVIQGNSYAISTSSLNSTENNLAKNDQPTAITFELGLLWPN